MMDDFDNYDFMPSGEEFWDGSWDNGGFYNDPGVQVDDPDPYGMPVPIPGAGWGYDLGDGYYMDQSGNVILPNGQVYNGSGDVWSGRGDGSTGSYSSPYGGNLLSRISTALGNNPIGALTQLGTLIGNLGNAFSNRRQLDALRQPTGAPGGAAAARSASLAPTSFRLPQQRSVSMTPSRFAAGGVASAGSAGPLGFLQHLASSQPDLLAALIEEAQSAEPMQLAGWFESEEERKARVQRENADRLRRYEAREAEAEARRNAGTPRLGPVGGSNANNPSVGGAADALQNANKRRMEALGLKRGGLGALRGMTKGQDDKVPALLSDGEYVMDADVVAALGDGNTEAGAAALDQFRENVRTHKRSAPAKKIPPKAKAPEQYLKGGK